VQAAVSYYGDHQAEIDEWIELNEREAGHARNPRVVQYHLIPADDGGVASPAVVVH
jgi:hypothetical protein